MSSLLEALAEWAVGFPAETVPASVRTAARHQLMSVLASIYSGAATPGARASRQAALALDSRGRATLLPTGESVSPRAAVLANAACSMAHDFDDYLFLGHTGHSAVLAILAEAEAADATLEQLLVAQVAANEVAGRLGAYVVIGPQNGQLWAHIHMAAAVVGAARLRGLSAQVTADALAIAFYLSPMALFPGFFGSDAKLLTAALPAAAGLHAVDLAVAGMTGARGILEQRHGFADRFAFVPLPELLGGLGASWVSESLSCKIYPGCAYVDGPVDAALVALAGRRPEPERVARIDIAATALTTGMERMGKAVGVGDRLDPIVINFSARRSVAIAALAGALTPRQLEPDWLTAHRAPLAALLGKTELRESRPLTLELLRGINRGVDLPALARHVGVGRLWSARGALRRAYAMIDEAGAAPSWRRFLRRSPDKSRANPVGSIATLTSFLRALGGRRGRFDLATARFGELEFRFAAEVTITLAGGERWFGRQSIPLGAAGRPARETAELVARKLGDETAAAGCPEVAAAITALLDRDPDETRASELARAACSAG